MLKELLKKFLPWVIVFGGAALIVILALGKITSIDPNTVTIKYIEDAATYKKSSTGGYTKVVSSSEKNVIKQWMELYKDATPKDRQTDLNAYSAAYPCYIVEFREGSNVVAWIQITTKEVAFGQRLKQTKYVGYAPKNPYYDIASKLMAEIEK